MHLMFRLLMVMSALLSSIVVADELRLSGSDEKRFPNLIIEQAIKRAGHSYRYPDDKKFVNMSRRLTNAQTGVYHIMWTLTSKEYEESMIPIRIPIYRGMLAMRVGIVRKDRVNLFANVKTLDDLKQFKAGQGSNWSDTFILQANGIKVVKEEKYPNLFPMLEGGRYDYFPRGIHEPWAEVVRHDELELTVEPRVMLRYVAPFYYFVSFNYPELAPQLEKVLYSMIKDGTYERMFFADPEVKNALERANVQNRIVFDLKNPELSPLTPLDKKELWFDPVTYKGNNGEDE
ncbi:hypothetical protein C2869_19345 [Saccharobesus litoralis]|uniref:Uncharacterized protein n=1 Tax=Saccharobesus litoralis TaxID=2172099 RepID=A0A2S0VW34_9ALTE|nr:transporter substrate-binding domain-containing protein [Saccharobesus litoralis]AWB68429.1 hypothetical protein C2869_19345 [Saccharobesus litoralis]